MYIILNKNCYELFYMVLFKKRSYVIMLDFLFKKKTEFNRAQSVNEMYSALKDLYKPESISEERRNYLSDLMNKYGYIPYSYSKACSELSDADVI